MHQTLIQGCRLTGKPSVSKIEILGSNPSVPANTANGKEPRAKGQVQIRNPHFAIRNSFWKGSLTGKAVVPKTTAHLSLASSSPVPSANRWRRRLMVWQRFAKSPRVACAGSTPVASAKVFGGEIERQHWWLSAQLAHRRKNPGTCSSAESERDSAKVEVARSNRARSTNQQIL